MHTRKRFHPSSGPRDGGVLLMALIAVLAVGVLSMTLLQLSTTTGRRQNQLIDRNRAFYLAEAGLAESFAGVAIGKTGNVGTWDEPAKYGDGLFVVEASELPNGMIKLESTGMVGSGRALLSMVVEPGKQSVATLGMFAAADLEVGPGSTVDGYDSSLGPYDPEKPLSGRLATNGSVSVTGTKELPTTVKAQVTAGPEGEVFADGVEIDGTTGRARRAADLPTVEVPPFEVGAGRTAGLRASLVLPPGEGAFEFLDVEAGGVAQVLGPSTLVLGKLQIRAEGELVLDASGGPIELFVTDDLVLEAGAVLTTTEETGGQLAIIVTAEPDPVALPEQEPTPAAQLLGTSSLHGVLYVPSETLVLGPDVEVFGAAIASTLTLADGARMHYDQHLAELAEQMALPSLKSWRLVDLENARGVGAISPFLELGVDPDLLRGPAQSHQDQWLDLSYVDGDGLTQAYSGMESAFDWSQVDETVTLARDGRDVVSPKAAGKAAPAQDVVPQEPAAADTLLAAIGDDGSLTSTQVKVRLKTHRPMSDTLLIAAIDRVPRLESRDLQNVLKFYTPLSDDVLDAMAGRSLMDAADFRDVLQRNQPVSDRVLTSTVQRSGIGSSALTDALIDHVPLSDAVITAVQGRSPALAAADQSRLVAAHLGAGGTMP